MDYESILDEAYEKVTPVTECSRFEILEVTGHHEGTKTVITNFSKVSTCLRRSSSHLMKFLTKELASSGEVVGDRLILSRKLSSKEINAKICKYVERFVTCPKCKKPDTEIEEEKLRCILHCLACGSKVPIAKLK